MDTMHDEAVKHYSAVTKLVHYTSKFTAHDDGRPTRQPSAARFQRFLSPFDVSDRGAEQKRFRLASLWPEWNEAEINAESWDTRRRDTGQNRVRGDSNKHTTSITSQPFEDPEGKVELPPSLKVDQWKRPIEFLPFDKPLVIADSEDGVQSFDLVTANKHLHHSETMRQLISQIHALWDICRREGKEPQTIERTWRPWEHIHAVTKVMKPPFIPSYNSAGKYVVRLFFLGIWRKVTIDDTIPFDSQNRCLLPQTSLGHELWPMLLSKALLKIIALDFHSSSQFPEHSESSIIHALTGWIPEPIPLKYGHAEKVWNFLRYDRSNKLLSGNESGCGPLPLFKWPETKVEKPVEGQTPKENEPTNQLEEKIQKKGAVPPPVAKSIPAKEKKAANSNPSLSSISTVNKSKKTSGPSQGFSVEDLSVPVEDRNVPDAPKMVLLASISHLPPGRFSSYTEGADRSERLRCYNINETFSSSMLLSSIRDKPVESPVPAASVPAWKLIRPRKPHVIRADPLATPAAAKLDRWIEIASPYINYPTASALHIQPASRSRSAGSQITISSPPILGVSRPLSRSRTVSTVTKENIIIEADEVESVKDHKTGSDLSTRTTDIQEKLDESSVGGWNKVKPEISTDKLKTSRKSTTMLTKGSSDSVSVKSKGGETVQNATTVNVPPAKPIRPPYITPKIWMDFDDFCACFTSITVFHNPRGYQYKRKQTELKFTPYQQPVAAPVAREKKRETPHPQPTVPTIPNLPEDKSSLYLFVDSTPQTMTKPIELIVSLTCLSRWFDAPGSDVANSLEHEKSNRTSSFTLDKTIAISQKEAIPQAGSLIVETHTWKSLSMDKEILRLRTTATKAAFLTLSPGRHVLKITNTCPLACHVMVMSDTNDFTIGDEAQLLDQTVSEPFDADFLVQAEELFQALDHSVQNFSSIDPTNNQLQTLFRSYTEKAPREIKLTRKVCTLHFHQALFATLRALLNVPGSEIEVDDYFAWRCFTNDLVTPDILGRYISRKPSVPIAPRHPTRTSRRTRPHGAPTHTPVTADVPGEVPYDGPNHPWKPSEIEAQKRLQRGARRFLRFRVSLARTPGTEKNLRIEQILRSNMDILKRDPTKSALLLFKEFLAALPTVRRCFPLEHDDWNMVSCQDFLGTYQGPAANTWFILFREVFYAPEESFVATKFLCHLPNSLLRVINNDNYEEMPLVFNRLVPATFSKNEFGYTFVAQGLSHDQSTAHGRYRLRLLTSYTRPPEPRVDPLTSSFHSREISDYYLPNPEQTICRYRVQVADGLHATSRPFHLASLHFSTSNADVLMRLAVFDGNEELVHVEGKGSVVLPAVLFMRTSTGAELAEPSERSTSRGAGVGTRKKYSHHTRRGSHDELIGRSERERLDSEHRARSVSQSIIDSIEGDETSHRYFIQVTLLHHSWPITLSHWKFVEQLREQEKNDLKVFNRQTSVPTPDEIIVERRPGPSTMCGSLPISKVKPNGKNRTPTTSRPTTSISTAGKEIDLTKPHWTLRVVCDANKGDDLVITKDTEREECLMNDKRKWEKEKAGRAQKAMASRQKFLDSAQVKNEDQPTSPGSDTTVDRLELHTPDEAPPPIAPPITPVQPEVIHSTPPPKPKRLQSTHKKVLKKEEVAKPVEPPPPPPTPAVLEPLLPEPPPVKPKIQLIPLDRQPFVKSKTHPDEPLNIDRFFEQEQRERRQNEFTEFAKYTEQLKNLRKADVSNRSEEKIRQLVEYVDLQAKVDQTRQAMQEPREAFRQRFLAMERRRLAEVAAREQQLLEEPKPRATPPKKQVGGVKKRQPKT